MKITRVSMLTGIERTLDLNATEAQLTRWKRGTHIQDAMPQLTSGEREFIMTGITDEEWDANFAENEDE